MTFAEMRDANLRRLRETWHHESEWSPADWLASVVGEMGELAHVLRDARWLGIDHNAEGRLADEIADTLLYLDILAARCGIDLGEAVRDKFNRTSARVGSNVTL